MGAKDHSWKGGSAVLYRSARESLIDWVTFKWRNEVRGVGLVVVWGKSFLVQEDSQGKGPEERASLTCLQNSKKVQMVETDGARERVREIRSTRAGSQIR